VYDLIVNTIYNKNPYYIFGPLESLRISLESDNKLIEIDDHGAGSKYGGKKHRTLSKICRQSVTSKKFAELLFRLVDKHKPDTIVELGTSIGLTTLYLSYAHSKSKIITVEGAGNLSRFAKALFEKFKRKNIDVINGTFQQTIPDIIANNKSIDFVFFDGHHEKEATLNYFNEFVANVSEEALFIFDDIHWSKEMESAWKEIKNHEKVTLTIDLFEMGLVYFNQRNQKEHFVIRF